MLYVESVEFDDLTDEQQEDQPDNGIGKEDASYIKIAHDSVVVAIYSDAMEPEDCRFFKDLKWIKSAIIDAYERGKADA